MDYSSKVEVIEEASLVTEEAKEMVRKFILNNDSLEGIQILQLEEFLNNV
ncbi:hypothetical protein PFJ87_01g01670 [Encephalitozoon hellem]|uniref:Uncharacterized protein n=1 Tax=Encephalitozoon hellem TaxID=27973 RepID=A0ABY8CGC6_ENCHE|nr:hypothetical protein PFJ87_01g01670 [Encephalitozoon hellem]